MSQASSQHGPIGDVTCVAAETFCVSGHSGQIRRGSEQGVYIRDTRVLNHLVVELDDAEPLVLGGHTVGGNSARFTACRATRPRDQPDPTLLLDRRRVVSESLRESLRLRNFGVDGLSLSVVVEVDCDFAYIFDVKHGEVPRQARCEELEGALRFVRGEQSTTVRADRQPEDIDERRGRLRWHVDLAPAESWSLVLDIGFCDTQGVVWPTHGWADGSQEPAGPTASWDLVLRCSEADVADVAQQSVADLASLLVSDPDAPQDHFLAAGSPWYLTLFGRDSLWAAMMALPLGLDVPRGTLRALARRQGRTRDAETEEAPGKIIHEVRHGGFTERSDLPPLYYGTMDATPLFVTVLHEAWRWGLDRDEVERLLPAAEAALDWLVTDADPDGDGFLEYRMSGTRGLVNQGWKDSRDGVQFADGRLAEPPIALCEVQGYAYEAACRGADLLEHFGRPGGDRWCSWAADLRERFRAAFWVPHPDGDYPAVALDGAKQRVDSIASNMGHLPGTGILDPDECALVARRLVHRDMASGWGLRTLTSSSPRFNPLSYHGGSVWPHDTAIAVSNLATAGHDEEATMLLRDLLAAAGHFQLRLPELFAGEQRRRGLEPLPYPAACRPQAWAAGSTLLLLRTALGVQPDLPHGRLVLRPLWPPPFGHLAIEDVPLGTGRLGMRVDADRGVTITQAPEGVDVVVEGDCPMATS
ncbi:MAG TPA: glycogen debranching N-terminal domain-containing protein [Egibacteraceae bacterium]|nr:glycogen debranching N-terminal domain-containing protein [Egibacteraceae bacterium]